MVVRGHHTPPESRGVRTADVRYLQAHLWVLATRAGLLLERQADGIRAGTGPSPCGPEPPPPQEEGDANRIGQVEAWADQVEREGRELRLRRIRRAFGLSASELDALVAVVAPHLESRFAALYRTIGGIGPPGDATPSLTVRLAGRPEADAYELWSGAAPLRSAGLVEPADSVDAGFLSRPLRPAQRVVAFLAGHDHLDDALVPAARLVEKSAPVRSGQDRTLSGLVATTGASVPLVYVRQEPGGCALEEVLSAFAGSGRTVLHLDLRRVGTAEGAESVLAAARREARLRDCPLVAGPVEALRAPEEAPAVREHLLRRLTGLRDTSTGPPLVLVGSEPWEHHVGDPVPLHVTARAPTPEERGRLWERLLAGTPLAGRAHLWADCRLSPALAEQAVTSADRRASLEGRPLDATDVDTAVRAHTPGGLERLTRRVEPAATLDDLVLPPGPRAEIDDLVLRARRRDLVLRRWRMRPGRVRGHGVTALFSGPSGTGKTLAAEALAHAVGGDLYVVNLATVVDKYIGETEKNLDRVFTAAADVHGVLLFDEADALFGRRAEAKDAHDRHANTQTAHLLQRLEAFDGVAVLTTNLAANIDDAFTRRLDHITHFPFPDADQRRALWHVCLGPRAPRAPGLDLDLVADAFPLVGGSIRSCAVTAAYRAAARGHPLTTHDLIDAAETEYRKLGLLIDTEEFDAHRRAAAPPAG
ncbi:ATP-binding protein [Kitasatospora sp. NPDC058048]|uniref:ATP-binding protein n=1 Tax=Kitasatospora sp. NPDC058048 TaxID=3346313 RepID=UPI0036DB0E71